MAAAVFWTAVGLLATVYVGYPLVIALWARLAPRPVRRQPGFAPPVSIVMAVRNEAPRLPQRLADLFAQAYPPERLEAIVVSDGSTDGTDALLEAWAAREPRLHVVRLPRPAGKAAALNEGVARSQRPILIFADARQRWDRDAVARLVENFADAQVGAVSGELIMVSAERGVAEPIGLYWRYEKWIRRNEAALGSTAGATGAIYALRRELWRPLPAGTLLDDVLAPMRAALAGRRVVWDGRARAWDRPSPSARAEFRRKVRTLTGVYQALALEPSMLWPWRNPTAWLPVWGHKLGRLAAAWALPAAAVASLIAPGAFYTAAAAVQAAVYGLAAVGWGLERRGRPVGPRPVSLAWTWTAFQLAAMAALVCWLRGVDPERLWNGSGVRGASPAAAGPDRPRQA